MTSGTIPTVISVTADERRTIYRALDISGKIQSGQAYVKVARVMAGIKEGTHVPEGTASRMVRIYLRINDYFLCYAHHYVNPDGTDYTEPDPKYLRIDDVVFSE